MHYFTLKLDLVSDAKFFLFYFSGSNHGCIKYSIPYVNVLVWHLFKNLEVVYSFNKLDDLAFQNLRKEMIVFCEFLFQM